MPNPFSKFGLSDADLAKHVRESAEVDAGLNEFMEKEVVPYWKSVAPVDSGAYAASIKVKKKAKGGKGVVAATVWYAHMVEYGTGGDDDGPDKRRVKVDGKWRTLPKDTPTRAAAPGEKTAQHFGGTLKGGITSGDDE